MKKKRQGHPILVPVDFSPHSDAALLSAIRLAGCFDCPLVVLHVIHDPGEMPGYYSRALKKKQLARIEDGAGEMMEEFLSAFSERHPEYAKLKQAETMLVKGLPTNRILEVAERTDAGMIVLGSRGLSGLKHLMLGSVAESVVHLSPIPVTVVKTKGFRKRS